MNALRLQAGSDKMRRVVGHGRDEKVRTDPLVQLVKDGPEPELGFQRAECSVLKLAISEEMLPKARCLYEVPPLNPMR
ncbi:MAG: hypothetical protein OXI87_24840 [Albidovulum sp.]|nr:hypothetical protein [Albidovulum sp.]MDE0532623.1 hypothetical protein [Albidovulum sp.]